MVLVRRDTREKITVSMDELEVVIPELLNKIHESMFNKAKERMEQKTSIAKNMDEFKKVVENKAGFVKAMWCGDKECEEK